MPADFPVPPHPDGASLHAVRAIAAVSPGRGQWLHPGQPNLESQRRGMIIVGIDEAGYGPLLGPLVVSAVGLDVPPSLSDRSLWDVLRASVTARASPRASRLAIADSKKLYRGPGGLDRLERAVLAWLNAYDRGPATFADLLAELCPHVLAQLAEYPWYQRIDVALPTTASPAQTAAHANALRRDLASNGIRLAGLWAEAVPEGHYNRLVGQTRNKAVALFGLVTRLVQRATQSCSQQTHVCVLIDKLGGRGYYARQLMTAFGDRKLAILAESPQRSAYRLVQGQSDWQIEFLQGGEAAHLPIALASIFSKYVRELFMMCLNRFWQERLPGLARTEGYYVDGKRFLKHLAGQIRQDGIDPRMLVRQR
jgi:ribonuclease HII